MTESTPLHSTQKERFDKLSLEFENLKHQNEKLLIEIQTLKAVAPAGRWEGRLARFVPVVTALIAVAGFWFGVIQYIRAENSAYDQRELSRIEAKREALKPLWDKQIDLYMDAAEAAASIALAEDPELRKAAEQRFWILYWGPLAAIEDLTLAKNPQPQVERAMVLFGKECQKPFEKRDKEHLKQLSLQLAHAIRETMPKSFDVQAAILSDGRQ